MKQNGGWGGGWGLRSPDYVVKGTTVYVSAKQKRRSDPTASFFLPFFLLLYFVHKGFILLYNAIVVESTGRQQIS